MGTRPLPSSVRSTARRFLVRVVLALLATGVGDRAAQAQQVSSGGVDGVTLSADDRTTIPFALIRVLRVDPSSTAGTVVVQQGVSNANGRFHFPSVPVGDYRLQLLRIGYRPVLSPVVRIRAGETLHQELRLPTQLVRLTPVRTTAGPSCLTAAEVADEPRLSTLWNEARTGVETRRAFELQYRFTRSRRQDITVHLRLRRNARELRHDTLVSEPDSVHARTQRRLATSRTQGYGAGGNLVILPEETDILTEDFLREHCLETTIAEKDGVLGIRFRPVQPRRLGVDIRGTIWIDTGTYQMRRLDIEHMQRGDPFVRTLIDYGDVAVGERALRLPTGGSGTYLRIRGAGSVLVSGATSTLTYDYSNIEQVQAGSQYRDETGPAVARCRAVDDAGQVSARIASIPMPSTSARERVGNGGSLPSGRGRVPLPALTAFSVRDGGSQISELPDGS